VTKKIIILVFIAMTVADSVFAQTLKERLILTDTKDSIYLNAKWISFDRAGNYCFEVKVNDSEYFYTNTDTIGGFNFIGSIFGNGGGIAYTHQYGDKEDKPWYFKNVNGTKIYGQVRGEEKRYMDGHTDQNMAITVTYNDSVYYYANDKLVSQIQIAKADKFGIENSDWCSFSENGNVIYYTKNDNLYSVYVNGKQIGTSYSEYYQLRINNKGQYIFAEGRKPKEKDGKYDFMFFTHSNDTTLGPVRTVWDCDLKENGGYYYSGDDNGTDYIVINNNLHKNLDAISNITLIDKTSYLFTYKENGAEKINVNGKSYTVPFNEIFYPTLDRKGNFAFYGINDFYLYKFVNGKQDPKPITKYDVRPTPLYISPKGKTLLYFKTDDSTYIYEDEKLLFPAFSSSANFNVQPYTEILPNDFERGKAKNGNNLLYLELDTTGYFIFNGQFSKPMIPVKESSYTTEKTKGEIVAGKFDDYGFFAIQKIGTDKFLININNTYYKEIDGVQDILEKGCYFDDKELVFYGIKGFSFYQYTLKL